LNAVFAIITALGIPLMLLNLLGGIGSGIWLAVLGEWSTLGLGITFFFVSTFLLGLVLMPGLALAIPAAKCAERGSLIGILLFGTLSSGYILAVVTLWCCGVLSLFVGDATRSDIIPRLIWSYGVATGPWSYMASRESGTEGEGFASTVTNFLAQVAYVIVMILVLVTTLTIADAIRIFGAFMLIGLILQVWVTVSLHRAVTQEPLDPQ